MHYSGAALTLLRLGVGFYLLFTAIARVLIPEIGASILTLYTLSGASPTYQAVFSIGVTVVTALLGALLLGGIGLPLVGVIVGLWGLVSGVAEIVTSRTSGLVGNEGNALLMLGLRDVLVLSTAGFAISAFSMHRRRKHPRVTMVKTEEARTPRPPRV